ncbi:hypothetical protein GOP47_0025892 [Adiantum capillus-veneris]|uniref:Transferrin-like domain-containing protein n=1 Tax=Adiantum capillus-veneris TaxID=13818 RepID=A0A9D4Z2I6_ADICA|nr:hypothetical protein GOP47_0025892 [Adiantum capillus-veneris]
MKLDRGNKEAEPHRASGNSEYSRSADWKRGAMHKDFHKIQAKRSSSSAFKLCPASFLLLLLSVSASSADLPGDGHPSPGPSPAPLSPNSPNTSLPPESQAPSSDEEDDEYGGDHYDEGPPPMSSPPPPPKDSDTSSDDDFSSSPKSSASVPIAWCAVREEIKECRNFVAILNAVSSYTWTCEKRDNEFECMQAIQKGDADVMSLDAGIAYIGFMDYQLKAIMMEEYCYFAKSYEAVAIVNKETCERNPHLTLKDFKGAKSCHSDHLTAAGWNYPIQFLVDSELQAIPKKANGDTQSRDEAVVSSFFSSTCAPSELAGQGLCTSCGNNGSCTSESLVYGGYSGAFRCLVDGTGDIAFVRSDTVERLSSDGKHAQEWSTKALDEFRYLCPQGGCRSINENLGNCTFGSVPANVLMTRNAQSNKRRLEMVQQLLNVSYAGALYNPQNWNDYVLSSSTQTLVEVTDLTRKVLGSSAIVAEKVQTLGENRTEAAASFYASGSSYLTTSNHWFLLIFTTLLFHLLWSQ